MPNTPSAKKRLRQNELRRERNRSATSALRSHIKKVRAAVAAGDVTRAEAEFRVAARRLDRAGAARVIHPNASARHKSRLQRLIRRAKQTHGDFSGSAADR
jgi:small subunit ribosomal protein S20